MSDPSFAGAFPEADEAQWRRLVEQVLKGAPFGRLVSRTPDGIELQPLYPRASGAPAPCLRAKSGPWEILTRIDHPDPEEACILAQQDLENGATGLHLVFGGAVGGYGFGLADVAPPALAALLRDVDLETGLPVEIDAGERAANVAKGIRQLFGERRLDPGAAKIGFGLDPLSAVALGSAPREPWAEVLVEEVEALSGAGFAGPFCVGDGRLVHAAGGSQAQELGYAVACGLAYLRALEAGGIPLDAARGMIGFRLAADADQFSTMGKLRALRRLWWRIELACGLEPLPPRIHAETAWRMMTQRDPWTNLLRTTLAVFSAGVGGADAVSVLPFTQALGCPDAFARRLARNTQLILQQESHIAKVADPASGSGGFEAVTDDLAKAAWAMLQAIEGAGGMEVFLRDGTFQRDVAATRVSHQQAVARRSEALVGTSDFVDLHETPVAVLLPLQAFRPAGGDLAPFRLAEPFEALRDRADAAAARGAAPKVFLAMLGEHAAMAGFARGFFAAGGIAAVGDAPLDPANVAEAFVASGAELACLCASDALYAELGPPAAAALRDAGARCIFVAGKPGAAADALRKAGATEFIFAGCDAPAVLAQALAMLNSID
jgi:methylmalonyl-CoA mutase